MHCIFSGPLPPGAEAYVEVTGHGRHRLSPRNSQRWDSPYETSIDRPSGDSFHLTIRSREGATIDEVTGRQLGPPRDAYQALKAVYPRAEKWGRSAYYDVFSPLIRYEAKHKYGGMAKIENDPQFLAEGSILLLETVPQK